MSTTHVVTGAASGIGRAVAERLVARSDHVVALVRSQERVEQVTAEVPGIEAAAVDLADAGAVQVWCASAPGTVHSLVQAAGVITLGRVADLDLGDWQEQLAVNLVAPAVLVSGLLPALRATGGTVVLVNSTAGLRANPQWSAYSASKWGLRAFADALRVEEPGIRVTSVFPGRTATPMQEDVHRQEGQEYDAARWVRAETLGDAIVATIDLPPDAAVSDLTVRPRG